jgi:glycosyltransferase involved in cell wall biosynthesis
MSYAPLVSVLTPSFQQGSWLADNLRSVANQTYTNLEHIVMDGGSEDGTLQILRGASDPRLRWWSERDRGQSHALNKALAVSRGEIVGWLNSDDAYFSPNVIQEAVDLFRRRPDVSVIYGHAALVNADGLILQIIWAPPFSRRLLLLHDFILQPTAFIRREALGADIADETFDFAMDYELWLRLSAEVKFARLDRLIAIDRHHEMRKSTRMLGALDKDLERLHERYGIHSGRAAWATRQVWKITNRLVGATLVRRASQERLAFEGHVDGRGALLRRQIGTRRVSMAMSRRSTSEEDALIVRGSRIADGNNSQLVSEPTEDPIREAPTQDGKGQERSPTQE